MTKQLNPMLLRFLSVYGPPKLVSDTTKFVSEYARQMRNFTDAELEAAADQLLRKRKYKSWPAIAECLEALENVQRRQRSKVLVDAYQAKLAQPAQPEKELSPAEQRAAERFVDEWADGRRQLQPALGANGKVVDTGMLSSMLRKVAQQMRDRRRARA